MSALLRAPRRLIEVVASLKRVLETVQGFLNAVFGCVATPRRPRLGPACRTPCPKHMRVLRAHAVRPQLGHLFDVHGARASLHLVWSGRNLGVLLAPRPSCCAYLTRPRAVQSAIKNASERRPCRVHERVCDSEGAASGGGGAKAFLKGSAIELDLRAGKYVDV